MIPPTHTHTFICLPSKRVIQIFIWSYSNMCVLLWAGKTWKGALPCANVVVIKFFFLLFFSSPFLQQPTAALHRPSIPFSWRAYIAAHFHSIMWARLATKMPAVGCYLKKMKNYLFLWPRITWLWPFVSTWIESITFFFYIRTPFTWFIPWSRKWSGTLDLYRAVLRIF